MSLLACLTDNRKEVGVDHLTKRDVVRGRSAPDGALKPQTHEQNAGTNNVSNVTVVFSVKRQEKGSKGLTFHN